MGNRLGRPETGIKPTEWSHDGDSPGPIGRPGRFTQSNHSVLATALMAEIEPVQLAVLNQKQ